MWSWLQIGNIPSYFAALERVLIRNESTPNVLRTLVLFIDREQHLVPHTRANRINPRFVE